MAGVLRASGYWAAWLYVARKFAFPPPEEKKTKSSDKKDSKAAKIKPSGKLDKGAAKSGDQESDAGGNGTTEKLQKKATNAASSMATAASTMTSAVASTISKPGGQESDAGGSAAEKLQTKATDAAASVAIAATAVTGAVANTVTSVAANPDVQEFDVGSAAEKLQTKATDAAASVATAASTVTSDVKSTVATAASSLAPSQASDLSFGLVNWVTGLFTGSSTESDSNWPNQTGLKEWPNTDNKGKGGEGK